MSTLAFRARLELREFPLEPEQVAAQLQQLGVLGRNHADLDVPLDGGDPLLDERDFLLDARRPPAGRRRSASSNARSGSGAPDSLRMPADRLAKSVRRAVASDEESRFASVRTTAHSALTRTAAGPPRRAAAVRRTVARSVCDEAPAATRHNRACSGVSSRSHAGGDGTDG